MKKRKRIFIDMDGTAAEWRSAADFSDLFKPGYFYSLAPTEVAGFVEEKAAGGAYGEFFILSAYYPRSYALGEKKRWNHRHLPSIDKYHQLYVPCGINKAHFVEELFREPLTSDDILVDDHTPNLVEWAEAGGKAIKWLNGINGNGGRFTGTRVGTVEDLDRELCG